MSTLPRVAIIGTGGTISSIGEHPLELVEYIARKRIHELPGLLAEVPELERVAEVVPVPFVALPSTALGPTDWLALARAVHDTAHANPHLDGLVITHGTATLEETAYFLHLTLRVPFPVVLVGAQRPITALSTDGRLNLVNAVRTAGASASRGKGVLVVLNDEIQCAREVTKTSTLRLQTFRSPDFGLLGQADPDAIVYYRSPTRRHAPDTEFEVAELHELPRVDVVYCYAGADGVGVDAVVEAGARGIVMAGFAPGLVTPLQREALERARERGVVVVQSSRAGSGRVVPPSVAHASDTVPADNLTPQKARVLLMLALSRTSDPAAIRRMFEAY
ncbi:MAG: asparaginase [Ectothiorhodospiraceae bacterium]|nr:asparaginase [Ectothiorhodospiraceae bacterium]